MKIEPINPVIKENLNEDECKKYFLFYHEN